MNCGGCSNAAAATSDDGQRWRWSWHVVILPHSLGPIATHRQLRRRGIAALGVPIDGLPGVDCTVMADTTTVKVQTSTRDLLLQVGASRRQSADQVILAALAAMQRDERRQIAAADARAIKDDPADLVEIRAIHQDMAALHEG